MPRRLIIALLAIGFASCEAKAANAARQLLQYAPAPVDIPLKGLVPYSFARSDGFPHSMQFGYVPLSGLVVARNDDSFAWATLDTGRKVDKWFFMAASKKAGPQALDKWRPGQLRPLVPKNLPSVIAHSP